MSMKHLILFLTLTLAVGCVRPKLYRTELDSRKQCEARESILVKEVLARREETGTLVQKIGDLNRKLGNQDAELDDLKAELTNRTILLGESSDKLMQEVNNLKKALDSKTGQLAKSDAVLQSIKTVQEKRREALAGLQKILTEKYPPATGVSSIIDKERVLLSLPDARMFEANGTTLSASGKTLLKPLAEVLNEQPGISVFIEAHTDNAHPKDKSIKDTWDWSIVRAANVVRLLISEYNVNANQLTPMGRGEFYPVTGNDTAEGRQKNRRTVAVLMPKMEAVPGVE